MSHESEKGRNQTRGGEGWNPFDEEVRQRGPGGGGEEEQEKPLKKVK